MAKYEKWLGAGLGWAVTGNPLGGLLGFVAGSMYGNNSKKEAENLLSGISEFETNLIVLATHLIKIDGKIQLLEVSFVRQFLDEHFDACKSEKRAQVLNHCLQKEYSLNIVCDQLRIYARHSTRIQIIRFLFDLAISDGELNERENYFIFKISGYLNVNDVDFRKIKNEQWEQVISGYEILGVRKDATLTEIRNTYRKLVLKYHPDKNGHLSESDRKKLSVKFQQIKDAYERIKKELAG